MKSTICFWAIPLIYSALMTIVTSQCFIEEDSELRDETSLDALAAASTNFAFDLFKEVVHSPSDPLPSGNVFISPISVWLALVICYLGTQGQTKKELGIGLDIDHFMQETVADLYPEFHDNLLHTATREANYTFCLANKLYFDDTVQLRECIEQRLYAEIEQTDLHSDPEVARKLINTFVEEQTNNKIVDLIPPGIIDSSTIMVIVNAAYFKGAWSSPFCDYDADISDGDFFVEPNNIKKVDMMFQNGNFPTSEDPTLGCSAIELPFSGMDMSMLILLPDAHNVQDLIQKLTKENVDALVGQLASKSVKLTMPKFKIEQEMDLMENVWSMGVNDLFEPFVADLSGFSEYDSAFVAFIRHKTYIEVSDYGVEAAAATTLGFNARMIHPSLPEFKVNRPFVFLLWNKPLDAIAFIGLIKDPSAKK